MSSIDGSNPDTRPNIAVFAVSVVPPINKVPLGGTATFECQVTGDVQVESYGWVGSEKIAREERFSTSQNKTVLHVHGLKDIDNNTWVDCTVRAGGREEVDSGRIVVLTSSEGWSPEGRNGTIVVLNGTMIKKMDEGEIPQLTAVGGVVIGLACLGFILVILAMFGVLRWLKKKEIQKEDVNQEARNRYSRIEIGPSARARYDRDQGNVRLGGGYAYGQPEEEEGENDDSYEDMLPAAPTRGGVPLPAVGQPPHGGRGGPPPPRHGGGNGSSGLTSGPRYQPSSVTETLTVTVNISN